MKHFRCLCVLLLCLFAGCLPTPTEILNRSHSTWTGRDGLTVAASLAQTNAADMRENFIVTVLPLTPDVVFSFNAMNLYRRGWDSARANLNADALLKEFCGLFRDEQGLLWTPTKGRYTGPADLDSLLVVVILRNRTWPCQPPTLSGVPLIRMADVPCDQIDIRDIDRRLYLVTAQGDTIAPAMVAGRENDTLTKEEILFVRFIFNRNATSALTFLLRREAGDITFDCEIQ